MFTFLLTVAVAFQLKKAPVPAGADDIRTQPLFPHGTDPCDGVSCGEIQCPTPFVAKRLPGHCCPYCQNDELELNRQVNGATGKHGGTPSQNCPNTWCFPTLCPGKETLPTSENGRCCPRCEDYQ